MLLCLIPEDLKLLLLKFDLQYVFLSLDVQIIGVFIDGTWNIRNIRIMDVRWVVLIILNMFSIPLYTFLISTNSHRFRNFILLSLISNIIFFLKLFTPNFFFCHISFSNNRFPCFSSNVFPSTVLCLYTFDLLYCLVICTQNKLLQRISSLPNYCVRGI